MSGANGPAQIPGQQGLTSNVAVSAEAVAAVVAENRGDQLPVAGSRHTGELGLLEHIALNAVQKTITAGLCSSGDLVKICEIALLGTLALLCEDDNILPKSPPSHIETAGWGASNLLEIPREV